MKLRDLFGGKKEKSTGLDIGLTKTKEGFFARLARAITGKTVIDSEVLDNIEETLIASDVGTTTTGKIIVNLPDEHRCATSPSQSVANKGGRHSRLERFRRHSLRTSRSVRPVVWPAWDATWRRSKISLCSNPFPDSGKPAWPGSTVPMVAARCGP